MVRIWIYIYIYTYTHRDGSQPIQPYFGDERPKSPYYCGFDPWNATILPGGRISFPTGQTPNLGWVLGTLIFYSINWSGDMFASANGNLHLWLVVWNMNGLFFHSVGNFIIPTDFKSIIFRGVAKNHQPVENAGFDVIWFINNGYFYGI